MNETHISKLWSVLPNKLYGMPVPEEKDLQNLAQAGIKSIVCLLEDNSNIENYNKNGFKNLWLPVADDKAPTFEQVEKLVEFIDEQNKNNNPVAIHCQGGKGRTGTLIASYLIAKGAFFDEAMEKIEANQPNAIKKDFQINFLKELSNKVK
ncbi:protein-tyrosine phosphatase family protein [Aliarcobacter cryaerophilus]|uniref:Protein phosphatase n=1 Tax=Aliarcobacter cryaerophilus TaxID=28198 RepID=A0A2S9TKY5_9BACT|nr:dual specificity protein phosphatase family protein [Aliarcobacter cryaerophilus]PRM99506.1 protein phosphatase [Arcobacter cryaerophilus gv. crypticus]